jgi:hypothetical protein
MDRANGGHQSFGNMPFHDVTGDQFFKNINHVGSIFDVETRRRLCVFRGSSNPVRAPEQQQQHTGRISWLSFPGSHRLETGFEDSSPTRARHWSSEQHNKTLSSNRQTDKEPRSHGGTLLVSHHPKYLQPVVTNKQSIELPPSQETKSLSAHQLITDPCMLTVLQAQLLMQTVASLPRRRL